MTDPAHLDSDELADLEEGLLDPAAERSARDHLADCERCQGRASRLAELREQLAADDPGPMPAALAGSLDAAVSAALAETAGPTATQTGPVEGGGPAGGGASRTTVPARPAGAVRHRPVPGWLAAAAAVVVVVGLGALGIKALGGGGASSTSAESSGQSAAAGAMALAPARVVLATGQDYSAATLPGAVPVLLGAGARASAPAAASGSAPPAAPSGSGVPAALTGLNGGPQLVACVTQLAGAPTTALAVDLASFDGTPAAIVVLPTPDDGSTVDVWVVGAGCGQGNDAQVRYFARVPR